MPLQFSVFRQLLQHVPWSFFAQLVANFEADRGVRRLSTCDQLVGLLYAQLCGATSLREIEAALASPCGRLCWTSQSRLCRSTLADANRSRPCEAFVQLLIHMAASGGRGLRSTKAMLRLIDATSLRLAGPAAQWALFAKGVQGAKAHVVFDANAGRPLHLCLTPAKVNDIVAARTMPIEAGATYVFDLGYYDFAWWAKLDEAGCRFVTRLKTNTHLTLLEERSPPQGQTICFERIGTLPARQAKRRQNPFAKPVREIGVALDTGKVLRIITNDLGAPAHEIAALYKQRWQIELFFRWIKHTLRIKHFLGRSQNAVCIQLAVALIAYLLLSIAKAATKSSQTLLSLARIVRINLSLEQNLKPLLQPPNPRGRKLKTLSLQTNAT